MNNGGGRKKGWMEAAGRKGGEGSAHDLLCKTTVELGVNSEAPPIRHSRLKTWPISGENKKEARPHGEVCVKARAGNGVRFKTVEYIIPDRRRCFFEGLPFTANF